MVIFFAVYRDWGGSYEICSLIYDNNPGTILQQSCGQTFDYSNFQFWAYLPNIVDEIAQCSFKL